jgi:hypothetical protein
MNDTQTSSVYTLGRALEERLMATLDAQPLTQFDSLLDLKNLAGESTGYVRSFAGERIAKGTSVSINMMPGARYFNIHIIPEPQYDVPRFLFEGMLMPKASQVSMDLFPDFDVVADIDVFLEKYASVGKVYEEARTDDRFVLQPSRLLHMRAFSSPVFLLVFGAPEKDLPMLEVYAERYFDAWLDMYRNGERLSDAQADARRQLRQKIGDTIVRLDPDRQMVVQIYGEETTRMIEAASMY